MRPEGAALHETVGLYMLVGAMQLGVPGPTAFKKGAVQSRMPISQ